ncbi:uncharacterized protein C10orf67 homolog, mitochondrial [Brachyhypopomus gauderio]|uniref:uncharacterized protein C10orf67 homolog, mitochondrial n=1 Tax=Brachyhypopomus gauderio TaxID=698409 RepID=UPI004041E691
MERSNRAWEKKFEILKQNFHSIKDEMFLRGRLQYQASVLHQVSVSYAMDVHVSQDLSPEGACFKGLFPTRAPLPSVGTGALPSAGRRDEPKHRRQLRGETADDFIITG